FRAMRPTPRLAGWPTEISWLASVSRLTGRTMAYRTNSIAMRKAAMTNAGAPPPPMLSAPFPNEPAGSRTTGKAGAATGREPEAVRGAVADLDVVRRGLGVAVAADARRLVIQRPCVAEAIVGELEIFLEPALTDPRQRHALEAVRRVRGIHDVVGRHPELGRR